MKLINSDVLSRHVTHQYCQHQIQLNWPEYRVSDDDLYVLICEFDELPGLR